MKILVLFSGNANDPSDKYLQDFMLTQSFIVEQVNELKKHDIEFDIFPIFGKGVSGYLKNLTRLKKTIKSTRPDCIHAHYGISGLLAVLQRKVPVIITFHGSDINNPKERILSSIASLFASYRIFVSGNLYRKIIFPPGKDFSIIPCGIDLTNFYPVEKDEARKFLHWDNVRKRILFSSSFENEVKNYSLAEKAVSSLVNIELIELKNKTRQQVNMIINACDVVLLTSFTEGSPQVIKEAMACNCPIVATDVGDIREILGPTEGCYLTTFDPEDVASKIKMALDFGKRTRGREVIGRFNSETIAAGIYEVYKKVLGKIR